jgi:hypothetical protein
MDTNGARALAARLGERSIDPAEIPSPRPVTETARPIFHWFGVEPPDRAEDAGEGNGQEGSGGYVIRRSR